MFNEHYFSFTALAFEVKYLGFKFIIVLKLDDSNYESLGFHANYLDQGNVEVETVFRNRVIFKYPHNTHQMVSRQWQWLERGKRR